jgi:hypothetical protein
MSSGNEVRKLFNHFTDEALFRIGVGLGKVPGWRYQRIFGMNDIVPGTNVDGDMWPLSTPRVLPTSAGVVSVVSDAAGDTNAGTGAWTVTILGLNSAYVETQETVVMAGLTPAVTTQEFLRVQTMFVNTAGTAEWNVGNITGSIGGNPQGYVEADESNTHQALFTVPSNHTYLIKSARLGVGRMGGSSDGHIKAEVKFPFPNSAWRAIADIYLYNGGNYASGDLAVAIPAKSEFRMQVKSTSATQAYAVVTGYLIDNKYLDDVSI